MTDSVISRLSAIGRVPDDIRHAARAAAAASTTRTPSAASRYVMLDCSGTTMDRYVDAPAIVFVEVFKNYGLEITMPEARAPMGLRKDLHIKAITQIASVRERFVAKFGREPNQGDVDKMFADFVPTQLALLRQGNYHELLPGVGDLVKALQQQGIRIGVTTGFTRDMLDLLLAGAAGQGFVPDTSCAGDEVEMPRPTAVHGDQEPRAHGRLQRRERDAAHDQGRRHRLGRRRGRAAVLARRASPSGATTSPTAGTPCAG